MAANNTNHLTFTFENILAKLRLIIVNFLKFPPLEDMHQLDVVVDVSFGTAQGNRGLL